MDGQDGDTAKQSTADMTAFVQNLLLQMQTRFQAMSESIISLDSFVFLSFNCTICAVILNVISLDEMGGRIDELEQSINDLRAEMGQEGSPSPSAQLKEPKDEPKSGDESTATA